MRDRDIRLGHIAERQHGVFSGAQAVACGYARRTVNHRRRSGLWVPVMGDTYRAVGAEVSWRQPIVAAWLAVGDPATVSHTAAAAYWELGIDPPSVPELTVPWKRRPRIAGIEIVRTRRWAPREMVKRGGLRITSPRRTLLDIAPRVARLQLETALDTAHRNGLVDLRHLDRYLTEAVRAKIPGAARLRHLVLLRDPDRPIDSELETLLFAVLRGGGLPLPRPQHRIRTRRGPKRIDFAYPEHRVAIEVDGYVPHDGRVAFDDDRARDNEVADAGWERRHITWTMLTEQPADVVWTIAMALRLEPVRWRQARG